MLTVKDLTFSFGKRVLLSRVGFRLEPGELVRIAGPNGAGKSTLLSLILGLLKASAGTIEFDPTFDSKRSVGWIPPDANALNPNLSAVQNLKFWLDLHASQTGAEAVDRALSKWGLSGEYITRHLRVGVFSTGMKRRLALARLELLSAPLWLLDEPLFGLDDKACGLFQSQLVAHVTSGGSAVVVTHDERLLGNLAHKTVFLGERV